MNEITLLVPLILSLPLQTLAVIALTLAAMNNHWLSGGIVTQQGLWQKCYEDKNMCFFLPSHDWVTLCRFMAITGTLTGVLALVFMMSLFMGCVVNKHRQMRRRMSIAAIIALSVEVLLIFLTLCVYWSKNSDLTVGIGLLEAGGGAVISSVCVFLVLAYMMRLRGFFEAQERRRLTKDQADNYE